MRGFALYTECVPTHAHKSFLTFFIKILEIYLNNANLISSRKFLTVETLKNKESKNDND